MKWHDPRLAFYFALSSAVWCIAAGLLLYFVPLGSSESASGGGSWTSAPGFGGGERLFDASLSSAWPLFLPAVICALASWFAARHQRWPLIGALIVLAAFSFVSGFSIGLFYVPAVVLLLVSALASPTPHGGHGVARVVGECAPNTRINLTNHGPGSSLSPDACLAVVCRLRARR